MKLFVLSLVDEEGCLKNRQVFLDRETAKKAGLEEVIFFDDTESYLINEVEATGPFSFETRNSKQLVDVVKLPKDKKWIVVGLYEDGTIELMNEVNFETTADDFVHLNKFDGGLI